MHAPSATEGPQARPKLASARSYAALRPNQAVMGPGSSKALGSRTRARTEACLPIVSVSGRVWAGVLSGASHPPMRLTIAGQKLRKASSDHAIIRR